jgi:hypothetical protein
VAGDLGDAGDWKRHGMARDREESPGQGVRAGRDAYVAGNIALLLLLL